MGRVTKIISSACSIRAGNRIIDNRTYCIFRAGHPSSYAYVVQLAHATVELECEASHYVTLYRARNGALGWGGPISR